jgi:curved DNA-binding protein
MTDYYKILGVEKTAPQDEVKKAYRKLAAKHHPDRGGNTAEFQKIEEAYRILSDPQSRSEYDNPQQQTQWTFNSRDFNDPLGEMFSHFGFGGFRAQNRNPKNKSINIRVEMTLKEIITGKEIVGSITLPSGKEQAIQLTIPPGVKSGDTIRFKELGDDSIPNIHRGDLIAQIFEIRHPQFHREGLNLITEYKISAFDAILGSLIKLETPEGKELEVTVPVSVQHGQLLKCNGHGIPKGHSGYRGDLYIQIGIVIPKHISEEHRKIISEINSKYKI